MNKKADLETKEDIRFFVEAFYQRILNSEIAYIFQEHAKTNWAEHIPIMVNFWSSMLLGDQSYSGNPMELHIKLAKHVPLGKAEFKVWLDNFEFTMKESFAGSTATEAIKRAQNIATLMEWKVNQVS